MKTAPLEIMPSSSARLYALSSDYRPELKPEHVLCDQSLPVEERIERAQAESIRVLNKLRPLGEAGDTRSQIEFAKEAKLLQWLCGDGAKGWVEGKYPQHDPIFTKYRFKVLDDGFVEFTLPKGTSYLELFEEANGYCRENGRERVAVPELQLGAFWSKRDSATTPTAMKTGHSILGVVPGSTDKTAAEQDTFLKEQGLSWAALEAAAAAAALYYCKTAADLLQDKYARVDAARYGLRLDSDGLHVGVYVQDDCRAGGVGAVGERAMES